MAQNERAGGEIGPVVIVGAGQAGFQVAASLRTEGYEGEILLIGDEPGLPYQRPPLSKAFIKEGERDRLLLRGADFYDKNRITLVEATVTRIDRAARTVLTADGRSFGYGHLVLAVGAHNRRPPIPGVDHDGVLDLRTLSDADRLRTALEGARDVVLVGGGFIGLEVAATARLKGCNVTVLEAADRLMSRVISPAMSAFFLAAHEASGIDVRLGTLASAIEAAPDGRLAVRVAGSEAALPADLVILAIGVSPAVELAREAGLDTADGVLVDGHLLTADPAISAVGDCCNFPHRGANAMVRLESVQNAVDQAKCVAARLMGRPAHYDAVAWFWSDQGPHKLQIAGLSTDPAARHVARPSEAGDRLTVLTFEGDALVAVETANEPAAHMAARKLLARDTPVTYGALDALGFDLRAAMKASA